MYMQANDAAEWKRYSNQQSLLIGRDIFHNAFVIQTEDFGFAVIRIVCLCYIDSCCVLILVVQHL